MSTLISIVVILAIIALVGRILVLNSEKIKFFATGLDSGFQMGEIGVLWKLAKQNELEEPQDLYVSVSSLNACIAKVISNAKETGSENSFKTQQFLEKLYKFRTRIALEKDNKRGLEDTRTLEKGLRVRIILPGKGVFVSKIMNNGRELVLELPSQEDKKVKHLHVLPADEWEGQKISVYFWRKGDAGYAFDTIVLGSGVFLAQTCLFVRHSDKLDRTQKRQSVRCNCEIYAQMYLLNTENIDYHAIEIDPGYRCLLEDISEDGAMIRVGGKGKTNVQIKLQFTIADTFVMMFGIVRAVEYNKALDQSRLHFECTHIEPAMKNAILSYVYKVIPEEQKEINEALIQAEKDSIESENSVTNSSSESLQSGIQLPDTSQIDENADLETLLK